MHSEPLSTKNFTLIPKWLIIAFIIISFVGFVDATYLTAEHFMGETVRCYLTAGCESVTTSQYSRVFGIPVALGGSLYYLSTFILAIYYLDSKKEKVIKILGYFTISGLVCSIWFVYLQAVVLNAWCLYCLGSAISSTLLFAIGMYFIKKTNQSAL